MRVGACLSLSGRYARFGGMAASGLEAWAAMRSDLALSLEDDGSEPRLVGAALRRLASRCEVLLGPYSSQLMREACAVAAGDGLFLWNHGGAGDDVQRLALGHVASVLTPAGRYAAPLLDRLACEPVQAPLALIAGRGRFGRQVVAGARSMAGRLGIPVITDAEGALDLPERWDLLCAGSFEEDLATVRRARSLGRPARHICAVGAGVGEFGRAIGDPAGILGLAQWFPGAAGSAELGPSEEGFLAAYRRQTGADPDYPAVQAAAAAELSVHCAGVAGSLEPASLWRIASELKTTTFFGPYAVDPRSGLQTAHGTLLLRWDEEGPRLLGAGASSL